MNLYGASTLAGASASARLAHIKAETLTMPASRKMPTCVHSGVTHWNGATTAPKGTAAFFAPRAGLVVDLAPLPGLKASLGAHYALPGTLTFYRESGSQLKRYDTGGAPGASLRLGWSF